MLRGSTSHLISTQRTPSAISPTPSLSSSTPSLADACNHDSQTPRFQLASPRYLQKGPAPAPLAPPVFAAGRVQPKRREEAKVPSSAELSQAPHAPAQPLTAGPGRPQGPTPAPLLHVSQRALRVSGRAGTWLRQPKRRVRRITSALWCLNVSKNSSSVAVSTAILAAPRKGSASGSAPALPGQRSWGREARGIAAPLRSGTER